MDLASDQSLERFRLEYERLHRALRVSNENEKRLLTKCKELSADIQNNAQKIQMALKMTQEDTQTIQFLKGELEKTYKMLEMSKIREEKSKVKIENLYKEIDHLNQLIQAGTQSTTGPTTTVNDLLSQIKELEKEDSMLGMMLQNVTDDIHSLSEKIVK